MVEAHGAAAEALAPYLKAMPVVVASADALAAGCFAMAQRRSAGGSFAGMLLLDGPGDDGFAMIARACMRLCDVLIVRSFSEYDRYRTWFEAHVEIERWIPPRDLGRWTYRGKQDGCIVVWGPESAAEPAESIARALEPLGAEIVVVDSFDVHWVEAVERAACVVDASLRDPSWSYAFAARGVPLAYAATTDAHEWIRGARSFLANDPRSIVQAVVRAIESGPAAVRTPRPEPTVVERALEAQRPREPAVTPLVSVMIPTYNRKEILVNTALRSVLAQSYENIEIVIVNDGGEKVADVAGYDPRIRVYDRETNVGAHAAITFGLQQCKGKYATMLPDDDRISADHVLRAVEVLERTGRAVVHADTLIRFEGRDAAGNWTTIGYNAEIFTRSVDREEALATSPVAGSGQVWDLALLRRLGWYQDMLLGDQELQIRLLQVVDFAHIRRFTVEFGIRSEGESLSRNTAMIPAELQKMYDLHPSDNSFVRVMREHVMANVRARPAGSTFVPTVKIEGSQ